MSESCEIPTSREHKFYGKPVSMARKSGVTTGSTFLGGRPLGSVRFLLVSLTIRIGKTLQKFFVKEILSSRQD
jgi:hypothetical protein